MSFIANLGNMISLLVSFLIHCFFLTRGQNVITTSIEHYLGERYKFEVFENLEVCKTVYRHEDKVILKVMHMRDKIKKTKQKISQIHSSILVKKETEGLATELSNFIMMLRNFTIETTNSKNQIEEMTTDFPSKQEFNGAVKAMFMLHYTYYLNMTSAVTKGILSYYNHLQEHVQFQVRQGEKMLDSCKLIFGRSHFERSGK